MNEYNNYYPYQYIETIEQPRQLVMNNPNNMMGPQTYMPMDQQMMMNHQPNMPMNQMMMEPPPFHNSHKPQSIDKQYGNLKKPTLKVIEPIVQHGLNEARRTSVENAMTKVACVAYLIGKGYPIHIANQIVYTW